MFVQLYGEKGKSDEFKTENKSDSFETAQIDKFMVSVCVCVFVFVSVCVWVCVCVCVWGGEAHRQRYGS